MTDLTGGWISSLLPVLNAQLGHMIPVSLLKISFKLAQMAPLALTQTV